MENKKEDSTEQNNADQKDSLADKIKAYFKNLVDFSSYDTKTILFMLLMLILVGISLYLVYILLFVDSTILYRIVVEWFVKPIYDLGFWGIFLFIGIMGIQGLLVPIPSEIVLLSTGMIWGWFWGGIFGIIGSVAAGVLCYYISRQGGRPLAEKFVGETAIDMADTFIHKYGTGAILFARFLPFIAFDPISYASGIVDLDVKKYTLATFVGSIPRAFFYSFLGSTLGINPATIDFASLPLAQVEQQSAFFNSVLIIIAIVLLAIFAAYYLTSWYWKRKMSADVEKDVN
ncbi:MAG: TVP38/TMEM64 family protein [Promethearchaeota archaeon]|nr:MAG: TVP38/TMEM64 family protein [Candidatus Lokiarchaeota archaeon]